MYIVKREDLDKFPGNLLRLLEETFSVTNKEEGPRKLDAILSKMAKEKINVEKSLAEFHAVLKADCNKSFRKQQASKNVIRNKSVPWWTEELSVVGKKRNALRRRFQRTRNGRPEKTE
jgi:hypothetical protein